MSRLWQTVKSIFENVRQLIASAMARLFGVNEDDYPATGVQPFEGEPADHKHF